MSSYQDPYPNISDTQVADKLGIQKGRNANYHCFSGKHEDKNPSLSITDGKGYFCHACGTKGNKYQLIKDVLGVDYKGALEWIIREFGVKNHQHFERNVNSGQNVKYHVRFINPNHTSRYAHLNLDPNKLLNVRDLDLNTIQKNLGKKYSKSTFENLGVKINSEPYCMVFHENSSLYNPNNKSSLLIMEGQTDFMTAVDVGLSDYFALYKRFNKTSTLIIPDNYFSIIFIVDADDDENNILNLLKGCNKNLSYLIIRTADGSKDLSDWYNVLNYNSQEIIGEIFDQISDNKFKTLADISKQNSENELIETNWEQLSSIFKNIKFFVPNYIPQGFLTLLVGFSGSGKSLVALNIIYNYLSKRDFFSILPFNADVSNILWIETEDGEALNINRASSIGINLSQIITFSGNNIKYNPLNPEHLKFAKEIIVKHNIQLIVMDSLSGNFAGDENSTQFADVVANHSAIAKELNIAMIIIHHERKSGQFKSDNPLDSIRGSSKISQFFRSAIRIVNQNDEIVVNQIKNNFGKKQKPFKLTINDNSELTFKEFESQNENSFKSEVEKACELILSIVLEPIKSTELKERVIAEGFSEATYNRARKQVELNGEKLVSKKVKDIEGKMVHYSCFPSQIKKKNEKSSSIPNDNVDNVDIIDNVDNVGIFQNIEYAEYTVVENECNNLNNQIF